MQIYEELVARGLIAQVTNEEEIKKLVNEGKAVFYIGFDPTADSLHVGHFMALCLMKRLQMAGNKPIALLGGGTGMIGDPSGRLWIGTMGFGAPKGAASLYCVWADGTVETKLTKVTISNGIVWSANKKYMYYNDTPTRKIIRFRYDDSSGDILYDGVAVNIPEGTGSPDGMTIDCNDNLWVAQWGGGGVYCYNPYTGDLLTKIVVPAPHVASCAFGGDKLDTLYITTARAGLSEEQLEEYPLSGSVFCCKPGAKGVPANCFH